MNRSEKRIRHVLGERIQMRFARARFSQHDGEDVRPVVPEEFIEERGRRHVGCPREGVKPVAITFDPRG
jgi:hypothetical protein